MSHTRTLQVLVDEHGTILGTAFAGHATDGAPTATVVAREGQKVVEVRLSEQESQLDAADLLEALQSKQLVSH